MSFVHHLTIGCFDLDPRISNPLGDPIPLRPLDRNWVQQLLSEAGPELARQFWFGEAGCLLADWYGAGPKRAEEIFSLAQLIADHHRPGCVVIHQNQGVVIHPEESIQAQRLFWEMLRSP
jgi:hypothetical protein